MAKQWKAHCLLLPHPLQGHVNPMLQFSKRLVYHKVKATFVIPHSFWKSISTESSSKSSVAFETISDGYDEGGRKAAESTEAYIERFQKVGSQTLSELLDKLSKNGSCDCVIYDTFLPVDCVIYDTFLPWVLDVAKKFGLIGAAFMTQSCTVNSIYFHLHQGTLKLPIKESKILLPRLPELEPSDLPSFLYLHYGMYSFFWDYLVEHFSNIGKADWVLSNTIYELEHEVVDWMREMWPLRTIGPTLPSIFLDERIRDDDDYDMSTFKPKNDICMEWLHDKPKASVIYVSFGSLVSLSEEQMQELACGLIDTDTYFLWVVRESEEPKLPKNIPEISSEKGLIVTWCPQVRVLSHEAVGCFVTHCGWNSTLEALSLGVPMIGVPNWSDQSTNLKTIVDVWKVGLRVSMDEKGILRQEVLKHCVKEVMESEKGKEMKENAIKWKNLIRNSVNEGGSSDQNIAEFVAKISQH
ncbi:LOW QUALITY PROTEIN: UDP-glycosyltransferase 74G1-like [Prosopis cineraria]|uniref:LOW QUALITY PROTEIN: UDP-glycosyltransferase 74G1-like n=1 Tax=Prosopis cineraria TaxID=364024 RepID=UPI00240FD2EE|nr:LOW QUALITY PROTEIN: UDP-glycosyltransferase 74G1-like [Prosopis cineraria]